MSYPTCPDPSHAGSRTVRAGWYGKDPYRRQRWKCVPANGASAHRFAEPLPRRAVLETHCSECSTRLDQWEGQAGPRGYLYDAREVAHALALVAGGMSYRRTALSVRDADRKAEWNHVAGAVKRADATGQLVANWVDVFAPVVLAGELPGEWPERIAIDSTGFRIGGVRNLRELHIFVAIGYDQFGARKGVWLMRPYPKKNAAAWSDFLSRLQGAPQIVVSDMDAAIQRAVGITFPATRHHWCEHHVYRSLESSVRVVRRGHPIRDALRVALKGRAEWDAYEDAVRLEHRQTGTPHAAMLWLNRSGHQMRTQTAARHALGPYSVGAVEATNRTLKGLLDQRAHRLGNRNRTELLLDLLTCGLNGQVNERAWAKKVRLHLEDLGGVPKHQRPHDDPLGLPSIYF